MAKGSKDAKSTKKTKQKNQDQNTVLPPPAKDTVPVDPLILASQSTQPPAVVVAAEPEAIASNGESQQVVPGWGGAQESATAGSWDAGANDVGGWGGGANGAGDMWEGGAQTNDLDWGAPGAATIGEFNEPAVSAPPAEPIRKSDKKSKKAAAAAAAATTVSAPTAASFAGLPASFGAPPAAISRASQSPAVTAASAWGAADRWSNGSPAKANDDLGAWGDADGDGEWTDPGEGAQSAPAWGLHPSVAAAAVVPSPPPPAPPPMQAPAISTQAHGGTRGGWMNWGRDASGLKVTTATSAASAAANTPLPHLPPSVPPSALPLAAAAPQKDRPVMSPQQRTDHLRSLLTHPGLSHAKSAPPQPQTQTYANSPAAMDKRQQAALYQQAAAAIGRQLPQRQKQQDSLVLEQQRSAREQAQQVLQSRMLAYQQQQQQQKQQHQQHQRHQQRQPHQHREQQHQHASSRKGSKPSGQSAPQMQQSDSWGSSGWTNAGYSDWADPIPEEDEEDYEEGEEWGDEEEDENEEDGEWGGQDDGWGKQDDGWGKQDDGWGKQDDGWGKQDDGWGKQDTYGYGWGSGEQAADWGQPAQPPSGYGHRVRFSPTVSYQTDHPGSRTQPPPAPAAPPAPAHARFHPSATAHPQAHLYPSGGVPSVPEASAYHPSAWGATTVPLPSKTLTMASGTPETMQTTVFELQPPRNGLGENAFATSRGHALIPAERALFSRTRPAKQRIRWSFNPDKDPRVSSLLRWVHAMSNGLATIGLQRFLETGERGALVANADYRVPGTAQPAFDWVTMTQLHSTLDRVLQESVALYDPAVQVIVFVFLLSQTGNSMAVWRRKLTVPEGLRMAHEQDIQATKDDLEVDYPVYVEELPPPTEPPKKKRNFLSKLKWRKKEKS